MVVIQYISGYKEKYYMESIFEQGKYIEITEQTFNDQVIKYRDQYSMKYNGKERIFTDKNTGLKYKITRGN